MPKGPNSYLCQFSQSGPFIQEPRHEFCKVVVLKLCVPSITLLLYSLDIVGVELDCIIVRSAIPLMYVNRGRQTTSTIYCHVVQCITNIKYSPKNEHRVE